MSILIIGGDKISTLCDSLKTLGVEKITHWDARKKSSSCKKIIPSDTDCVIMLTSFLNHNAMKHYKSDIKKKNIPFLCSKHSVNCVYEEYIKLMRIKDCKECYAYNSCKGGKDAL